METMKLQVAVVFVLTPVFLLSGAQFHYVLNVDSSCGPIPVFNNSLGCCMMENNRSLWYSQNFPHSGSEQYIYEDSPWRFENNTGSWDSICGWASSVAECIGTKLPQCNSDIGDELFNNYKSYPLFSQRCGEFQFNFNQAESYWMAYHQYYISWSRLLDFYRRTCSRQKVKPHVQLLLDDPNFDSSFQCINGTPRRNMYRCARSLAEEFSTNSFSFNLTEEQLLSRYTTLIRDIMKCIFSMINRSPCNTATKQVLYHLIRIQVPSFIDDSGLKVDQSTTEDFSSSLRCSVGVFGDPHLRTCWGDQLITCSASGEQTYIRNKYFSITGHNEEIGREVTGFPRATSLRSVLITFNSLDGSSVIASYNVTNGDLPTVFDNNRNVAGSGNDQVMIHDDLYRVRFVQKSTGTVIVLRQWSGNYFFTARAAESIILDSTGLLPDGCPEDEIITFNQFVAARKKRSVTYSACTTGCSNAFTDQAFITSCTFDCLATENQDFALNMSMGAQTEEALVITFDNALRLGAQDSAGSRLTSSVSLHNWFSILAAILLVSTYFQND